MMQDPYDLKARLQASAQHPNWGGLHSKRNGKTFDLAFRDIAHCMPILARQAMAAAAALYAEDEDALRALDLVGRLHVWAWNRCMENNLEGLNYFSTVFDQVKDVVKGPEALSTFNAFFVQAYFVYMFAVHKMAIGVEPQEEREVTEFVTVLHLLSVLKPATRRSVLDELYDAGHWPSNIPFGELKREIQDFIPVVLQSEQIMRDWIEARNRLAERRREMLEEAGKGERVPEKTRIRPDAPRLPEDVRPGLSLVDDSTEGDQ